jgi:hypothetical protein
MAAVGLPYGAVQASGVSSLPGFPSVVGDQVTLYRIGGAVGLQYSDFGEWMTGQQLVTTTTTSGTTTALVSSYGFYGVGVPTPTSQMPTTGTALYTGSAIGVLGYTPTGAKSQSIIPVTGVADIDADFATGALSGGIVGLRGSPAVGTPPALNNVVFTGTISGNTFSGTTGAGTNTGNISLTGAAGAFGGGFYGPNAKEITGTFSLAGSGIQLIGSFGAHK